MPPWQHGVRQRAHAAAEAVGSIVREQQTSAEAPQHFYGDPPAVHGL